MPPVTRVLFLGFLLLLPVEGWPELRLQFGSVSAGVLDALLVVALYSACMRKGVASTKFSAFAERVCLLLLAVAGLSVVNLLYVSEESLGRDMRMVLNTFEFCGLVFVACVACPRAEHGRQALFAWALGLSCAATFGVLRSVGFYDLPGGTRTSATMMGPLLVGVTGLTDVGMQFSTLALGAFPALFSGLLMRRLWLRIPVLCLVALACFVSFSRNLWFAAALQLLVFGVIRMRATRQRFLWGLAGGVAAMLALSSIDWAQFYTDVGSLRPGTVAARMEGYKHAIDLEDLSLVHVFFGAGAGRQQEDDTDGTVLHNMMLDLLVGKGVLVLLLVVAVFASVLRQLSATLPVNPDSLEDEAALQGEALLLALVGLLAFGMFAPTFNALSFWATTSLAVAFVSGQRSQK